MKKAPGRRVHDQDRQSARTFLVLVYPSATGLSSRTLRHLSGLLAGHRRRIGSRWRRLTCGRQALLVMAHLRYGDTYARLAAGFRMRIATAYRCIREAIDLPAALAGTGHGDRRGSAACRRGCRAGEVAEARREADPGRFPILMLALEDHDIPAVRIAGVAEPEDHVAAGTAHEGKQPSLFQIFRGGTGRRPPYGEPATGGVLMPRHSFRSPPP